MLKELLLSSFVLLMAVNSFAYSVDNSTPWNTTALTGFSTTGAMMDGMTVTATFLDGTEQTAIWADTASAGEGAATGTDFRLRESDDTFSNRWTLTSFASMKPIRSLQIDAGAGNSVFDILYDPTFTSFHSPGSANGYFDVTLALGGLTYDVIFSGPVSVNNVFYGDLYRNMTVNFTNTGGYVGYNYFGFKADTDSLLIASDIKPLDPNTPVPEPSTILYLVSGLAGLAFWRGKKRM